MLRCSCLARTLAPATRALSTSAVLPAPRLPKLSSLEDLRREDGTYDPYDIVKLTDEYTPGRTYSPQRLDGIWQKVTSHQLREFASTPDSTPYSIRAVPVGYGQPLSVAWNRLHFMLDESNIRQELRRNQHYEKPTAYRHRVASERHRRRFKHAIGQKISTILRMKKKGL